MEWVVTCLSLITKHEIYEKEYDFVYGMEEYTNDINKIKRKFKRLLKNG